MRSNVGWWTASGGLRDIANSTISTVIALLSLLAVGMIIYGVTRAIIMNRRTQVVVSDLVTSADTGELAKSAQLSPVLRQFLRRDIQNEREQVARIGKTILRSASPDLEPQLRDDAIENIQRTANDSITAISAALGAVIPENADRFVNLLSSFLPPPRGLAVTMTLLERGTDRTPQLGTAVDVAWLDGRALASTTFWENACTAPPPDGPQPTAVERALALLEAVSRWIAVRLVVTLVVSSRSRSTSAKSQGLQRLLAGGLFLAAMRDFPLHALAFGEQARAELEQAEAQMPDMPLPLTTLAGVHERMGWARRADGNARRASDEFRTAVRLWQKAQDLVGRFDVTKLAELNDRRLKAQLESEQPRLIAGALTELAERNKSPIPSALASNSVYLYNRACLYAQASESDPNSGYLEMALRLLGLALIRTLDDNLWEYAVRQDPELTPIRGAVERFLAHLRNLISEDSAQANEADYERLVANALASADLFE